MDLTAKQLKKMMSGSPVQLSHGVISSLHPEVLTSFGEPLMKKISTAVRLGKGVRVHLKDHEREVLGGKIDWKKVGKSAKAVGKMVARPLISGATNALVGAATTAIGQPELAPFVAPLATTMVNKALDKAHLGFGAKEELKKLIRKTSGVAKKVSSPAMFGLHDQIAHVATPIFDKAKVLQPAMFGLHDQIAHVASPIVDKIVDKAKEVAGTGKRGRPRKHPIVLECAVKRPRGRPRKGGAMKLMRKKSGDDSESDEDEIKPKHIKKMLMIHFGPHVHSIGNAKELANVMMEHGPDALDHHPLGGSLSSMVKKGAKKLYHYAKPVIKYFGEQAIQHGKEYAKEGLEDALGSLASSYGVDPSVVKMGTSAFLDAGEELAKKQLAKHTTGGPSQTPEHAMNRLHADSMQSLQNKSSTKSPSLISKSAHLPAPEPHMMGPSYASSPSPSLLSGWGMKLHTSSGKVPLIYGGAVQEHMGLLLDHTNPAWLPYHTPPNLPQGQVSGGSFLGAYGVKRKYGGSFV